MKRCSKCKQELDLTFFRPNRKRADGLQTNCIECQAEYNREHYKLHKKDYTQRAEIQRKERREVNRTLLLAYLRSHPCSLCGEADPIVLEFDHLLPSEKEFNISAMIQSYSWKSVLTEIEKCRVLCANCHRKHTAIQFNWHKAQVK